MNVIGTPRRRVDGRAKVTGQTRFADDVMLPRMLYCKLLRSTMPHARIVNVDVSRAAARPGVHLVLTGKDFPITYGILPVSQDEHALAVDRVRFVGDPVAAVIARDELTAFEALDFIDVEYEPLRNLRRSTQTASPIRNRASTSTADAGNIHKAVSLRFGDVEQAFADADRVFEDTFFYQGNTHLPIEQHAAVAALGFPTASWSSGRARRRPTTCTGRSRRRWRCRRRTSASSRRPTAAASAARAIPSTTRWSSPGRR